MDGEMVTQKGWAGGWLTYPVYPFCPVARDLGVATDGDSCVVGVDAAAVLKRRGNGVGEGGCR